MQQTRLGSSSVTSPVVTACSSVMLQTSCPPGTSFPTCFLWLLPSKFGSKLWMGRSCPFSIRLWVDWSVSPCGCWYPPFRAELCQCRCLRKEVLGSSLTLPSCLLRRGLATYPHSPVPRCFAEDLYQSPSVVFPACFLPFLLWHKKSFRSGCSHPGYAVGVDISKRAATVLLLVLWRLSGPGLGVRQEHKTRSLLLASKPVIPQSAVIPGRTGLTAALQLACLNGYKSRALS